ncbi:unnamed protein product [Closterium sp. NIES-53]
MSGLIPLFLEGSVWRSVRWLRRVRCLRLVSLQRLACVGYSPTKLSSDTTASVTPPCRVSAAFTPVSLSLAFPCPCPPSRAHLPYGPSLHRGVATRRSSLLRVSSDHFSSADSPHGRLGSGPRRYFLLVVDGYTHYTIVFPLQHKAHVSGVLIPWNHATHRQLRERFCRDLPVRRLHYDRGGEFSSDLLAEFCQDKGMRQMFTFPASPQQNGIAERCIGLIIEVACTSMIHAAAPHFLWPFAVRYAAYHLNLWARVSQPETSPTLRWTGKVGDASVFRVWGALSLVRDA